MWEQFTVIVAEDEDINYYLLVEYLEPTGIKILRAKNGIEVLDLFEKQVPNLILMDIKMPVMNGLEAAIKVREMNPEIPILAQTAYSNPDDIERLKPANFEEILSKPLQEGNVLFLIKKYLNKFDRIKKSK